MYTLADYADMMADAVRIEAYAAALGRVVRADSIVADLGAGVGLFALLAARAGARRVYAIEPDDVIHLGRAIAAASGVADRIDFLQARSIDVVLPERATIIVSDLRGTLPQFGRHLPAIADARGRLLAEGGILIPRRDHLWAAIVEEPELHADHVAPWREHTYDLDLGPAERMLANTWRKSRVTPDRLLSDPHSLAVFDYRVIADPDLDVEAILVVRRTGTGHGLCIWFDSELVDGIGFSNAPGPSAAIHGQGFFPFGGPMPVNEGDSLSIRLQANLVGDDYIWRWTHSGGRTQSTLNGVPLGAQQLLRSSASHVPALGTDGEIDLFVLARMHESLPLGEIARELLARFPGVLRDWNAALGRAGELSRRYSTSKTDQS